MLKSNINDLNLISKFIYSINKEYEDYILIQLKIGKEYIVLSDEENSIIYREGYLEAGGNFKVYRKYKGIWSLENEGFGSPTYYSVYIGDIDNIEYTLAKNDIVDLITGEVVIYKYNNCIK